MQTNPLTWHNYGNETWKILQQRESDYYPEFKIIISSVLPMGDFDFSRPPEFNNTRTYRTRKGYRVFFTGLYNPDFKEMIAKLYALGCDHKYIKFLKRNLFYSSRIEPKMGIKKPLPKNWGICQLVSETGTRLEPWNEFIDVHDYLTRATQKVSVLI